MGEILRWPYDEVSVQYNRDRATVLVTAPWLNATVQVAPDLSDQVQTLAEKLEQQNLAPADLALVNWFFEDFDEYPFCYRLPTMKQSPLDRHALVQPLVAIDSIEGFLRSSLSLGASGAGL